MSLDPALKDALLKGLLTIGQNLITAIVTAYFAVKLALRRFYFEKRWERKADAYAKIMTALHHVKDHAIYEQDEHLFEMASMSDPERKVLSEGRTEVLQGLEANMRSSIGELQLQIDLGTFALSEEAVSTLKTLVAALDEAVSIGREQGYDEYLDHRTNALTTCIEEFRALAKYDLDK